MKSRIVVAFATVEDAKTALGHIKQENWQANLTVIMADQKSRANSGEESGHHYEFATEHFIAEPGPTGSTTAWPGLREDHMPGVGKVRIGSNKGICREGAESPREHYGLSGEEQLLPIIQKELQQKKIIGLVEIESEALPRVGFILESNGATILDNQAVKA